MKGNMKDQGPWLSLALGLGLSACSAGVEGDFEDDFEAFDRALNECTTTKQCKQMYEGATDCDNGGGGVCLCGNQECADGGGGDGGDGGGGGGGGGGDGCPYYIAYDSDGNIHDYDDIHATPMAMALVAEAGLQDCVVHWAYNTNLAGNTSQADDQKDNVVAAINRYGFDGSVFFDVDGKKGAGYDAAKSNFVDVMKKKLGSSKPRLFYVIAGPMHVPYDFIAAGPNNKEKFITAISHSPWNDKYARGPKMNTCWDPNPCQCGTVNNPQSCTAAEESNLRYLSDLKIKLDHINNQNPPAFNSNAGAWSWLHGVDPALHDDVTQGPKSGDASDAGMMFYLLKGRPSGNFNPTMNQIQNFF